MIQTALAVVGSFKGSPQVAKVTGYVQDAVAVVNALTPLVNQFAAGQDITEDDVKAALAGKDAALKMFDDLIKQKGG
jgi:hypothetical protein